jgi:outer membrane protein OmpA-like peptidoglycan-associated protein
VAAAPGEPTGATVSVPFAGSGTSSAASPSPAASAGGSSGSPTGGPGTASGRRKTDEPPEPGPTESSLRAPTVGSTPQPALPQPPPTVAPQVSWTSEPPQRVPSPAAVASASPQSPPAPPTPAPLPATTPPATAKPAIPFLATTLATINFAAGSTTLGADDRQTVARVAAQFKQTPGMIRVVAYAAATAAGAGQAQLASFQTALDRAQAVAAGLAQAGVPTAKVQTQAAPAEPAEPAGRVEIRFIR